MSTLSISTDLAASMERLYETFAKCRQPADSERSPFSAVTDQDVARLYSRPLRELTVDDLSLYARHALTTWGDIGEYKHYLPRLFELLVMHPGWTDDGLLIGLLATAEWKQW